MEEQNSNQSGYHQDDPNGDWWRTIHRETKIEMKGKNAFVSDEVINAEASRRYWWRMDGHSNFSNQMAHPLPKQNVVVEGNVDAVESNSGDQSEPVFMVNSDGSRRMKVEINDMDFGKLGDIWATIGGQMVILGLLVMAMGYDFITNLWFFTEALTLAEMWSRIDFGTFFLAVVFMGSEFYIAIMDHFIARTPVDKRELILKLRGFKYALYFLGFADWYFSVAPLANQYIKPTYSLPIAALMLVTFGILAALTTVAQMKIAEQIGVIFDVMQKRKRGQ